MKSFLLFLCVCIGFVSSSSIQNPDNISSNVPQISAAVSHVQDETNATVVKVGENSNDHLRKTRGITVGIGEVGLAGGLVSAPGKE